MSSPFDEGGDALLDRMEHITEEEEEDMEDRSMDHAHYPPVLFCRDDDDVSAASFGDEEYEQVKASRGFQWANSREEISENMSHNSQDYNISSHFDSLSEESTPSLTAGATKRSSFSGPTRRRSSASRRSFNSLYSAGSGSFASDPSLQMAKRRGTVSASESDDEGSGHSRLTRQNSVRRKSVNIKPVVTGNFSMDDNEHFSAASSGIMKIGMGRKASRRTSHSISNRHSKSSSQNFDSFDTALSSLGQTSNSEWENVAAAAAVVAAGVGAGSKNLSNLQFAVGEKVLVFLNIMNHTNSVDPQEAFTVQPVNKFGYPRGQGGNFEEQQGPFVYVLATVQKVHFDEDIKYYTVARADTGTLQRADTAWMEQCKSPEGIESALRAARETSWSMADVKKTNKESMSFERLVAFISWPIRFHKNKLVPFYRKFRSELKELASSLLFGDSPFSCSLRCTGINLLVICSFIYLFLETATLAFFPSTSFDEVALLGACIWTVLALELIMELVIRPSNYFELIASDKAYAPSTARYISAFHVMFEIVALALYIPDFVCLHGSTCGARTHFSGIDVSMSAVLGPTRWDSAVGRFAIGLRTLRIFGLVRHWKQMWINNTFRDDRVQHGNFPKFFRSDDPNEPYYTPRHFSRKRKAQVGDIHQGEEDNSERKSESSYENDRGLKKAATIGTALMVVNSHRALLLLLIIVVVLPMISTISGVNNSAPEFVGFLQATSELVTNNSDTSCAFLQDSFESWLAAAAVVLSPATEGTYYSEGAYILWAQVLPVRCNFQSDDGVISSCDKYTDVVVGACAIWNAAPSNATPNFFADLLDIPVGAISEYTKSTTLTWFNGSQEVTNATFSVKVLVNQNQAVMFTNISSFILLFCILLLSLTGLTVLRGDAGRLVLHPLQRMLKIVVRYAQNPLSSTARSNKRQKRDGEVGGEGSESDPDKDGDKAQLGNYETEQLINAISKIADLLRKCWGVAGAGIISSNLARTQDGKTVVFNPTVPGKRVYALFGFVAINGFSEQLRALDRDVMILINDVAKVVHDEVFRWALGDSGQCNKNLGAAFLMVFRIGDFTEVHEKKARATEVLFSGSKEKRNAKKNTMKRRSRGINHGSRGVNVIKGSRGGGDDTLQLASLPGIQSFSDRALLGLLKSFAGIHRDRNLQNWKKDFRLGAGVGAYTVSIVIGMDAGWAVEGAVGSEYKIDATYLSPHVNMASRMMSAAKQYGVTILLSQAVEELLSPPARNKLRHLDTVFVKGSSVAQRIFTYDARNIGVDFFLFERSAEQSDLDAEAYTPLVWESDQDLRAMRQHVTEDFERKFREGSKAYLHGDWKEAIIALQEADEIMITTVLEEGYIDYNPNDIDGRIFDRHNSNDEVVRIRNELGDGTCKVLVAYMEKRNGICPPSWTGVRPLTSK